MNRKERDEELILAVIRGTRKILRWIESKREPEQDWRMDLGGISGMSGGVESFGPCPILKARKGRGMANDGGHSVSPDSIINFRNFTGIKSHRKIMRITRDHLMK